MSFSRFTCLAMALAPLALANPAPLVIAPRDLTFRPVTNELLILEARERGVFVPRSPSDLLQLEPNTLLEKRVSEEFSLEQTLENQLLFDGAAIPFFNAPPITVVCKRCCTKGTIKASLTLDDVINPTLRFDLKGVEAFIELDVVASASTTFTIPLFIQPPSPLGINIPGGPKIGLLFFVDLIVSVLGSVDLSGGFIAKLPEEAFFEVSIFEGVMSDFNLDGIVTKEIPIVVNNGASFITFQADLQLRAQLGLEASTDLIPIPIPGLPDFGAAAEVGVFVNIIEFIAKLEIADECALQASENFNLNVGAFANFNLEVGSRSFGAVPAVSTTLLQTAFTQCVLASGLPFPTRTAELPTAPSCLAVPTAPAAAAAPALQTGNAGNRGAVIVALPVTTPPPYISKRCPDCDKANATAPILTETVLTTTVVTVTGCAAQIPNCPGDLQNVGTFTSTICAAKPTPTGVCPSLEGLNPLPSLSTPIVGTFTGLPATTESSSVSVISTTFTVPPALITQPPGGVFVEPNSTTRFGTGTGTGSPFATTTRVFVNGGTSASRIGASVVVVIAGIAALAVLL